ncbi:leucine-rich repeat-containing protein 56 isoform X2 [Dicentrarchus labrax]|uniref:leucine-rich repeat-containing protein 56 isoform X2 n=1 Tax=Dicentrarchus labrax TaxID=13489 RepID=UPI0021F54347|nr:leucine-rich repeat-containing protein 56 isoform X2 [Dicentrarchus labrax]
MSCCHGSVLQEVRPGTARVVVTELSGSDINPTPAKKHCDDFDTELLCGTQDLTNVTSLEICVNTQENTLGNFGAYLPNLVELRMSNSTIVSIRDLGTTLSHLQVLWMSRCSLQDLEGISNFSSLKELYMAYNFVSDLSQVVMLENLQLLDMEDNDVDDLVQVQYLGLCGKLQRLTLAGNPVCVRPNPTATQTADYSYRAEVRELVPQLRYLDDLRVEEDEHSCSSTMGEHRAFLQNTIRDFNSSQAATEDAVCIRPRTGSRPMSATRPGICSPPGSRPASADSDLATVEAETSILTQGAGKILFCGNPVQSIRAMREKLRTAPTRSTFIPNDLLIHVPEHTYDLEEPDVRERGDVFAELRAWREQHSRRLQAIEAERLPQVLAIRDSDSDDDDEEETSGSIKSDSSDEERGEEKHCGSLDTASSSSSFQSLSIDLHHREALSPNIARLSLSPDTSLSPSPPLSATAATGNRKPLGIRARRLLLNRTNLEHLPDSSKVGCSPGTSTTAGETDLTLKRVQQLTSAEMDISSVESGNKHLLTPQMSKLLHRPAITRPHTARAVLQKHHPHHIPYP